MDYFFTHYQHTFECADCGYQTTYLPDMVRHQYEEKLLVEVNNS